MSVSERLPQTLWCDLNIQLPQFIIGSHLLCLNHLDNCGVGNNPIVRPHNCILVYLEGCMSLLKYHLTVVDGQIESESVLDVWVIVDQLEVCPRSTAEMFPLDQRNDCQVSVLAPHFPLCQQTNVPVRCWDSKIDI